MIKKLLLALILIGASVSSIRAEIYDTYLPGAKASLRDKKTLIVVIGAEDWWPTCVRFQAEIRKNASVADGVNLAFEEYDTEWGKKIYKGTSVPALVKYKWDGKKWTRTVRIGYLSMKNLKRFINE